MSKKSRKLYGYITENMPDRDPSLPKIKFDKYSRMNPPPMKFSNKLQEYETFDVYKKKKT